MAPLLRLGVILLMMVTLLGLGLAAAVKRKDKWINLFPHPDLLKRDVSPDPSPLNRDISSDSGPLKRDISPAFGSLKRDVSSDPNSLIKRDVSLDGSHLKREVSPSGDEYLSRGARFVANPSPWYGSVYSGAYNVPWNGYYFYPYQQQPYGVPPVFPQTDDLMNLVKHEEEMLKDQTKLLKDEAVVVNEVKQKLADIAGKLKEYQKQSDEKKNKKGDTDTTSANIVATKNILEIQKLKLEIAKLTNMYKAGEQDIKRASGTTKRMDQPTPEEGLHQRQVTQLQRAFRELLQPADSQQQTVDTNVKRRTFSDYLF